MLKNFTGAEHIYLACGYTDLRRGIDGLVGLIEKSFALNPFADSLFLFCGRRSDRIKAIFWEGDGFVLLYKRLEQGSFRWPRTAEEVKELTEQEFRWLMEGLKVEQPRALKPVKNIVIN